MKLRAATCVRVFVPVTEAALAAMLAGQADAAEADPVLAAILRIVRADNPLGDFGLYSGVAEMAPGWESFRPAAGARPALGAAGETALSPTAILTIHAACAPG